MNEIGPKELWEERGTACNIRFTHIEKLLCLKVDAAEKAVLLAREDMNRRLEGMNEFRTQLEKQASTFVDKNYYDVEHRVLREELNRLREWKSVQDGKSSWTSLAALGSLIVAVVAVILHLVVK